MRYTTSTQLVHIVGNLIIVAEAREKGTPKLSTPDLATVSATCTCILGGGTSSWYVGSTSPGDSVGGTPVGVSEMGPQAAPHNRGAEFGIAGGAERERLVPS